MTSEYSKITNAVYSYSTSGNYDVKISNVKSLKISSNNATYYNRATQITRCYIPDSVSILEPYCFYYCSRLSEVQGGNRITSIGSSAFYSCYSLATASFPNVISIRSQAFAQCSSLATASFPNASSIGTQAFAWCRSLTTASFPNVTSIGSYAFNGCSSLTTASFPNVTSIGEFAFNGCNSLTTASFPNATSIKCFGGCRLLKSVYVENSVCHSIDNGYGEPRQIVTNINDTVVYAAVGGISCVSNSNVTSIGSYVFQYCSSLLTASFLNATSIGTQAFYSCRSLTTASFPNATSLGTRAFAQCSSLTTASFQNVTSIGAYAFYLCASLITASFPNATSIGANAFYQCSSMTTASFPNATSIGSGVFDRCISLTTVSFPQVTSIGSYAFQYCSSLKSIYFLGSSVPTLANSYAFSGVHPECKIYVPSSLYTQYMSANNWIYVNSMLTSKTKEYSYEHSDIEFKLNDKTVITPMPSQIGSVVQVKTNSTTWNPAYSSFLPSNNASKIEEVVFNNRHQTQIGVYAFYSIQSLKKARDIYASIEQIGASAFYNCSSLTTVSFPNVTSIGSWAFYWCTSLTIVSFPQVISIRPFAFRYCTSLTRVSFPNVTSIGASAFQYCYSLTKTSFPNATSIGTYAFYSCRSLTTVSFPNATSIGASAFYSCRSLKSVYFMGSSIPTLANSNTFSNVHSSYSVYVPESLYSQYLTANNWSLIASHITSYYSVTKSYNMNELCDVAYFKWQPADRGYVFQPDSSIISTVKDVNGNYKFSHKS